MRSVRYVVRTGKWELETDFRWKNIKQENLGGLGVGRRILLNWV